MTMITKVINNGITGDNCFVVVRRGGGGDGLSTMTLTLTLWLSCIPSSYFYDGVEQDYTDDYTGDKFYRDQN